MVCDGPYPPLCYYPSLSALFLALLLPLAIVHCAIGLVGCFFPYNKGRSGSRIYEDLTDCINRCTKVQSKQVIPSNPHKSGSKTSRAKRAIVFLISYFLLGHRHRSIHFCP